MTRLEQIGGQVKSELDDFIRLVNVIQPISYLEIGAREGIALRYFVERVPSIKLVTVIDLPGAKWGRAGSSALLLQNLNALDAACNLYLMDSAKAVDTCVMDAHYSVVFIDGDHSYEGVKFDYETYGPLADDFIALHDINHPPDSKAYGPTRLWNEVLSCASNRAEFIAKGSRKGIGVLII